MTKKYQANQLELRSLEYLFTNGGEMGTRIRQFDWTTTPIGPIETWPHSLEVALQILLLSKFPMQILWGSEYIQFYNDAYIPIAGNKHPTALGQRGADCWKEVWDFAGPLLDQVMTTGTATWSEDQLLVLNRQGYPEEGYFTFSYTPIWEGAGRVEGIFIAVHETTQRILSERRERELRIEAQAAREEAEQANQIKDQFLAVLSHELRSPLNPILGWSQLLLSRKLSHEKTQHALETIARNAKLQAQMIDDLLDISRILQGKLVLNRMPLRLPSIINDALETVRTAALEKDITIQTQLTSTPLEVLADANRLKQVVWNLLSNAVKFTPNGGQVTIQLDYVDEFAHLQVMDTGKGITADFLPHVFEHFQQADSLTTKQFGGLGLGLAIAKQIVDTHGGTIQATSPGEGKGTTFTVKLPLTVPLQPSSQAEVLTIVDDSLENLYVLVVEDDIDNREMIVFTLKSQGARVTAVASAAAALESLSQCQPDLIICDIGMPGMDGYDLIQQVRETTQSSQVPAIALTAYAGEADRQRALATGFQEHLSKPIEPAQLIMTIWKFVQGNSSR